MRTPHWFLLSASLALLLATDAVQGQQHGASHSAPAPRAALPHYYHAAPRPVPANHPVNHSLPANGANRTQVVTFHRQNFYHNTYVWHGQTYNRFYRRYNWHGVGLRIYTPARFYPIGFYGWAGRPWGGRVTYGWGWRHRPWYGYYGYYFAPYPYYVGPSAWLTDYMLSSDLEASYDDVPAGGGGDAPPPAADAAPDSGPELTPEIKNLIAQEIQADIEVENGEAALNAAGQVGDPETGSIAALLADGKSHVFVAGAPLEVETVVENGSGGAACSLSLGDVLQETVPPGPQDASASLVVLASKTGGNECAKSATVAVKLADLQQMRNHMRESVDQGLQELQQKQGTDGLPAAPPTATAPPMSAAFTQAAPAPEQDATADPTTTAPPPQQQAPAPVVREPPPTQPQ